MSYILDALKRADAERERGAVPGLHTQQVTTPVPKAGSGRQRGLWPLFAGFLLLFVAGIGLWVWQGSERDTRAVVVAAAMPPASIAATPPQAVQDVVPVPLPKPAPSAATAVAPKALPKPQARPAITAMESKVAPPAASVPVAHAAASAAPTTVVPVPLLSELAEDIRRQIPALTITGAVDSDYPAQRMLLVNGQVLKQGSMLTSDLSLEEIRAHSSVLSFRGTKFRITY